MGLSPVSTCVMTYQTPAVGVETTAPGLNPICQLLVKWTEEIDELLSISFALCEIKYTFTVLIGPNSFNHRLIHNFLHVPIYTSYMENKRLPTINK